MAPRAVQGTVIILDIGKNVSSDVNGGKSFFHSARDCVARILERKILSGGNSLVGVLLLGCRSSNKENADEISFSNIEWMAEPQEPTWDMIRNLPKEPTKYKGDWMDSLLVATDYLKNKMCDVKLNSMKIVIMTNFEEPTTMESKKIQRIFEGLQNETFEIDVIGPDINEENSKNCDFELARQLVTTTDGTTATFDYTMRYLLFHKKKAPNPTPCNMDLCIGPNLKIPVSSYIRIKDESVVGKWKKNIRDPLTLKASITEGITKEKTYYNTENHSVTESTDVSKAYHYGEELIPLAEYDKSIFYKSGEKGLFVYGFTDVRNIQWQSLSGDGIHYIFGKKGDKNSQHAIRCLVECLEIMKLAGVVRKVHYNNTAPKMFALMPVIDKSNYICLSLLPLCFKEEIKHMMFPPINMKKYSCTDEQVNAFKDLIKAMDLAKAYDETFDDTEAFPVAETVSPAAQYILDCIAFRALNPEKPLPQPRDEVMALFKVPPLIEKQSRQPLEKIKRLFTLKEIEEKTKKRKIIEKSEMDSIDNEQASTLDITQPKNNDFMPRITLPTNVKKIQKIGTVDPVGNFTEHINAGNTLSDIAAEMTGAIKSLIYFSSDESYAKALNALLHFRKECVKSDPHHYNVWLQTFKIELGSRKKDDVLNIIAEKNLDYILKSENSLSTFDNEFSHDESQMYKNDTVPDATDIKINEEVNDMFDDM